MAHLEFNTWSKGSVRAPHKPLLLLLAIGAWQNGRQLDWATVKKELGDLLDRFSTSNRNKASHPFIRLQNDGLWHVDGYEGFQGDARVKELNDTNPTARLSDSMIELVSNSLSEVVDELLLEFPPSLHSEILDMAGVRLERLIKTPAPEVKHFRRAVLNAYSHQCAVCGFGGRLDQNTVGIEAAHIRMRSKNGPNSLNNGMALCMLHHKLFDEGAYHLSSTFEVVISKRFHGTKTDPLLRHEGQKIALPRSEEDWPHPDFIQWQQRELFKA